MADRAILGVLLSAALAVSGCAETTSDPGVGVDLSGGAEGGTAGTMAYERVATDALNVSVDGSQVLADCWNGICRWSAADGSSVTAVAFSADGTSVAAAALDDEGGTVVVWSVADGSEQSTFTTVSEVHTLAFSPGGDQIATAGNGPVEVHDIASGEATTLDTAEGGTVTWSPNGRSLLTAGMQGQPVVWNTAEWRQVAELPGLRLHEAAYSPDSTTVALSALDDSSLVLWSPGSQGPEPARLPGHTDEPGAVAWSPDGRVVYSVAADDGVLAWRRNGSRAPVTFEVPAGR